MLSGFLELQPREPNLAMMRLGKAEPIGTFPHWKAYAVIFAKEKRQNHCSCR